MLDSALLRQYASTPVLRVYVRREAGRRYVDNTSTGRLQQPVDTYSRWCFIRTLVLPSATHEARRRPS